MSISAYVDRCLSRDYKKLRRLSDEKGSCIDLRYGRALTLNERERKLLLERASEV